MPLDDDVGNPVARRGANIGMRGAVLVLAAGLVAAGPACGPRVSPQGPGPKPGGPAQAGAGSAAGAGAGSAGADRAAPGREILVGEMCPDGAAGGPGVAPLFVRAVDWSDDPADVSEPLARNAVRQFAVLGLDGTRAGVFTVMGVADAGLPQDVAIGSYAGRSPCARPADAKAATGAKPVDDPACVAAQRGCGLAIAPVVPGHDAFGELDATATPPTGTACVAGDVLVVDIDGDGTPETFALGQFLDPVRAPADEVTARSMAAPPCTGTFSLFPARVDTGAEPGQTPDPRYRVELDVVGVADVDGDGRRELFIGFHYPDRRTLAVYSATSTPARLERVGEALPWHAGQ
jgi:hypothetical protein